MSEVKTITRKSMLYKTGVEYGDYAMNHVEGCSHGCTYPCYAYLMAKRFGRVKTYEEWCKPKLVSNTLELLYKEIPKLKSKIKNVHLCFTTDPFMYGYDDIKTMSMFAIAMLNQAGIPCTVLTKGILPINLSALPVYNSYGISLVSLDEDFRKKYEPNSAPYAERIAALKELNKRGFKTWVSIEPYPMPNMISQRLLRIMQSVEFVNKIVFGRANYCKEASSIKNHAEFYNDLSYIVKDFCNQRNIKCHIKEGTEI